MDSSVNDDCLSAIREGDRQRLNVLLSQQKKEDMAAYSELLIPAIKASRPLDLLEELLSHGLDVNVRERYDDTPLTTAMYWFDERRDRVYVQVVAYLIDAGADVNTKDNEEMTPLHFLCCVNCTNDNHKDDIIELVRLLLDGGADLSAWDGWGCTPLHYAVSGSTWVRDKIVRLLLEHGADVNARSDGDTPLHWHLRAWEHGFDFRDLDVVSFLLDHQTDINAQTDDGATPLLQALASEHSFGGLRTPLVELLLNRGANASIANKLGMTPLHKAAFLNSTSTVEMLIRNPQVDINARDYQGNNTPLHLAAANGYPKNARLFLDHQADINATNNAGDTPLHIVLKNNRYYTSETLQVLLCEQNAEVNVQNANQDTPLSIAVKEECVESVRLLMERGANMNIADRFGMTPLVVACEKGNLDMIYSLIRCSPHHWRPQLRRGNNAL